MEAGSEDWGVNRDEADSLLLPLWGHRTPVRDASIRLGEAVHSHRAAQRLSGLAQQRFPCHSCRLGDSQQVT